MISQGMFIGNTYSVSCFKYS